VRSIYQKRPTYIHGKRPPKYVHTDLHTCMKRNLPKRPADIAKASAKEAFALARIYGQVLWLYGCIYGLNTSKIRIVEPILGSAGTIGTSKETYIFTWKENSKKCEGRRTYMYSKETYKGDMKKRPADSAEASTNYSKETYKRDLQKRHTKETCKRDLLTVQRHLQIQTRDVA